MITYLVIHLLATILLTFGHIKKIGSLTLFELIAFIFASPILLPIFTIFIIANFFDNCEDITIYRKKK